MHCHACGKTFRSMIAEARHRHNWPTFCTRNKRFAAFMAEHYPPKENPDGLVHRQSDTP